MVLFVSSSLTSAWLGASRAASGSMCAAASVAHQLDQPDEKRAASSSARGQVHPCSGGIAVVVYHHASKCKYSDTQLPVS